MTEFKYDKLVRDKIPEIIRSSGEIPITHHASDDEIMDRLANKLVEEADEFHDSRESEELADVLDVVDAIRREMGLEPWELDDIRHEKTEARGGFDGRVVLEEVEPR